MPLLGERHRSSSDRPEELRATLGEHLEELRQRIFRIVAWLAAGMVIGWFLSMPVYDYLTSYAMRALPTDLEYREPFANITEPFFLKFKLAFLIGLFLTLPFTVIQVWGYLSPGLRPHERRPLKIMFPISIGLFFGGAYLAWAVIPRAFAWFAGFIADFPGTSLYQKPGELVFLIVKLMLAFGVGFQLPIVVFVLTALGVVDPDTLIRQWRYAIVAIFAFSAIITPTGDAYTLIVMASPLCALFFGSAYLAKILGRSRTSLELDDLD